MTLLVLTAAFAYLFDAFLVGALFALFRVRHNWRLPRWPALLILLVVFVVVDTYWLPAVTVLDARLTIGNTRIAKALGVSGEVPLINFFSIGWFDVLVWGVQVVVASWVADRL